MIRTVYSNRFEVLQVFLSENLKSENKGVFENHTVIVPSPAIEDRLRAVIARDRGICCGYAFSYLGDWFYDETGVESANEHTTQSLVWPIWRILHAQNLGLPDIYGVEGGWGIPT